jgi:hypothetical protein
VYKALLCPTRNCPYKKHLIKLFLKKTPHTKKKKKKKKNTNKTNKNLKNRK